MSMSALKERYLELRGILRTLADLGYTAREAADYLNLPLSTLKVYAWRVGVQMAKPEPRSQREITYQGWTRSVAEWARDKGLPARRVRDRLDAGWAVEDALETPLARKERHRRQEAIADIHEHERQQERERKAWDYVRKAREAMTGQTQYTYLRIAVKTMGSEDAVKELIQRGEERLPIRPGPCLRSRPGSAQNEPLSH